MAPNVTDDFIANVQKYYEDQKPYDEKLKEAMKQEPSKNDKPKPRFADIEREKAKRSLKPLSEFDWNFGVNVNTTTTPAELLKTLSGLQIGAKTSSGAAGKDSAGKSSAGRKGPKA